MLLEEYPFYPAGDGLTLLWLEPWNGQTSLLPSQLDVCYIEICRRVRLQTGHDGGIHALTTGTRVARIDAKALKGRTGDGWTPLVADGTDRKALTITRESFSYKQLTALLFPRQADAQAVQRAPLQAIAAGDDALGLEVIARGMVRGQGKTEGFHERRVPVSTSVRRFLTEAPTDYGAAVAADRVADAGLIARKVLYPAALLVFTGAPLEGERKRDDDTAKKRAGRVLAEFDDLVDRTFFEDLAIELEGGSESTEATAARARWILQLMQHARTVLDRCAHAAPSAAMRSYRTRARARDQLERAFHRYFGERTGVAVPSSPSITLTIAPER